MQRIILQSILLNLLLILPAICPSEHTPSLPVTQLGEQTQEGEQPESTILD